MARPTKQGVDYFPFDVHLDDKFKFIEIKCGLEGFAVIVKLLQKVYSYGYWYAWGEDEQLMFAHENRVDCDLLKSIVDEALNRGVFDEGLYEKYAILTSSGIQKRYQVIVKRRKGVEVVREYLLINGDFGDNEVEMEAGCLHDVDIVTASCNQGEGKDKQSKVDKSKEEYIQEEAVTYQGELFELWNSQDIIVHKVLTDKMIKAMKRIVKDYSLQEIKDSIELYAEAYHSDFYFNHKYTLEKFLRQSNGVPEWTDEGSMYESYLDYVRSKRGCSKGVVSDWRVDAS